MMQQTHGVPAILSFFFPGLGQLCKDQWNRAATIWTLILAPWVLWGLASVLVIPEVMGTMIYGGIEAKITMFIRVFLSSPVLPLVLLLNLAVHLWSVVDAYRRPV